MTSPFRCGSLLNKWQNGAKTRGSEKCCPPKTTLMESYFDKALVICIILYIFLLFYAVLLSPSVYIYGTYLPGFRVLMNSISYTTRLDTRGSRKARNSVLFTAQYV